MLSDDELQYYLIGFYRILKRYRSVALLGWTIVFVGCLSVPLVWSLGGTMGFMEMAFAFLTVLAGLTLAWQNISALTEYLRVPFPSPFDLMRSQHNELIAEIKSLMKEIDDGGWREASDAIGQLEAIAVKYELVKSEPLETVN